MAEDTVASLEQSGRIGWSLGFTYDLWADTPVQ